MTLAPITRIDIISTLTLTSYRKSSSSPDKVPSKDIITDE